MLTKNAAVDPQTTGLTKRETRGQFIVQPFSSRFVVEKLVVQLILTDQLSIGTTSPFGLNRYDILAMWGIARTDGQSRVVSVGLEIATGHQIQIRVKKRNNVLNIGLPLKRYFSETSPRGS